MNKQLIKRGVAGTFILFTLLLGNWSIAIADDDEDLEALQRALNQKVMERPFDPGDQAEIDAFVENALKKNQVPEEYKGNNWRRGYTCADLRQYGYYQYRNCLHYYRYHGRYYPY